MVRIADADDFSEIPKFVDKFRISNCITQRIQQGDVCVVVYCAIVLAHVRWAALKPLRLPELNFTWLYLDPTEAYMYDAYTLPAFRYRGYAARARNCLIQYLPHRGISSIYRMSQVDNPWTQYAVVK
ncbi:MAG: hypothetical protein JSV76_02755 [Candidatus Bathyarchaeota archaeon]|nr:MAG: hypothetical protein JSV76_02755 [Candidatus Bathyarchaeota archaeon]